MDRAAERFFLLVRKYLEVHLPHRRGVSPQTVRSYRQALSQYVDYLIDDEGVPVGKVSFDAVTEDSICGFLDKLESRGCSVSTRNQRLAALRAFLAFAAQEDVSCIAVLARAQRVPKKKASRLPVGYLGEEDLAALFEQPDASKPKGLRDLVILVMLYDTAARASELVGISLCDLHLNLRSPYAVLHGKGSKIRSVPLMDRTVELLGDYIARFHTGSSPTDPLFYTTIGGARKRMSYENVAKLVAKYGKQAKASHGAFPDHLHPHMLRHTRAMHLYQDGIPLSYVKEVLGHSNINTTSIYASSDVEMLRKAMAPLDIELPTASPVPSWQDDRERLMKMAGLR